MLGFVIVVSALVSSAPVAFAHAAYKSSDPPDEGRVGSPPARVTAEFTEPLAGGSYLQVTDPCGRRVDEGDVAISGYTMSVSMNGVAAGRYVVFYRAHSQLDPHVTQGEFQFTATSGDRCPGDDEPSRPDDSSRGGRSGSGDAGGATVAATGTTGGGGPTASGRDEVAQSRRDRSSDGDSTTRSRRDGLEREKPFVPGDDGAVVPNLEPTADREGESKPVWDGIRLESFLTGLLLAAIIGAAGGKIYAGIMGPRG